MKKALKTWARSILRRGLINKIDRRICTYFSRRHEKHGFIDWLDHFDRDVESYIKGSGLTPEQKKQVDDFWGRYFPYLDYSTHAYLAEKTGHFDPAYIPEGWYYMLFDRHWNNWDMALQLDHKCLYAKIFKDIRLIPDICYRMNGYWYDAQYTPISEQAALERIMQEKECFAKIANNSACGRGVHHLSPGDKHSAEDIRKLFLSIPADIVVQEAAKQHPVFAALNADSVNTVRSISYLRPDGEVIIYSRAVRMGVGHTKIDNLYSGGMIVGIDAEGKMKERAYNLQGDAFLSHPASGITFKDTRIPHIDKVDALVKKAHHCIPFFRICSWDTILDIHGEPHLLEANMKHGGVLVHQITNGPLFGADLPAMLEEVFGKR